MQVEGGSFQLSAIPVALAAAAGMNDDLPPRRAVGIGNCEAGTARAPSTMLISQCLLASSSGTGRRQDDIDITNSASEYRNKMRRCAREASQRINQIHEYEKKSRSR